jgi:hypothetical protein
MDAATRIGLCQPASAILLVSVAGVLYHILAANTGSVIWWLLVGLFGTGIFQALCFGGLEPIAWILMSIPVLVVCFFLAVALFASRMRIDNIMTVPCNRCQKPKRHCGCHKPKPSCGNCQKPGCERCFGGATASEGFVDSANNIPMCGCKQPDCPYCNRGNQCPYGRCDCPRCGGDGAVCPYCPGAVSLAMDESPVTEGFACANNACMCMGGSCYGACKPGGALNCGGAGCPNCTYQNRVVSEYDDAQANGLDLAYPKY